MPAAFEIVPGSGVDIPALEPLWVAVHHRPAESMPELGPYVRAESRGAGMVRRSWMRSRPASPNAA